MFAGFPKEGLELLAALPGMDKEAFGRARPRYGPLLQAPIREFVEAMGPALQERISVGIQYAAKTHGSIGPINNDVRFNPDRPTYKDHVLLRFWDGESKKTSPSLFVRLTPTEVGFAAGAAFPSVETWRTAVDRAGDALGEALKAVVAKTGASVFGDDLKRVPKGYPAEHPHEKLLRHSWLQVRWPRPLPSNIGDESFVDWCCAELAHAAPLHAWLVRELK